MANKSTQHMNWESRHTSNFSGSVDLFWDEYLDFCELSIHGTVDNLEDALALSSALSELIGIANSRAAWRKIRPDETPHTTFRQKETGLTGKSSNS